jgi:hypothetical protein
VRRITPRLLLPFLLAFAALGVVQPLAASAAGARPPAAAKPAKPAKRLAHHGPTAKAALCGPTMTGDWRNIDPNTRSMTRAVVDYTCNDVVLCDIFGHCSGGDSYYSMHVFGKCHPTDCDWGRLRATDMGGGWIKSTYNFGFATDHVWLKTYQYYGLTYLRVWVYTDFTAADGRTDYTSDE